MKKAINTLLYSFGSEAPCEVIWGLNEMIEWLNEKHKFSIDFLEEPYSEKYESEDYNEEKIINDISYAFEQLLKKEIK